MENQKSIERKTEIGRSDTVKCSDRYGTFAIIAANHGIIHYLAEFFKKRTDEEHAFSAGEICDYLAGLGIVAERKDENEAKAAKAEK